MSTTADVRRLVYRMTADRGRPPRAADVAGGLGLDEKEVLARFRELYASRLLLLAPDSGEIVMAPPFSAVPTGFAVDSGGVSYWANCVWDAYGVPAALRRDASITASCGCCGEPMTLPVERGEPVISGGVAHFAVPAARWWDDLVYT